MTEEQIEAKLTALEQMIAAERDWKKLPTLNACCRKLIDKLVELDAAGGGDE